MTVGRMWRGILAGVLGMALLQGVTAASAGAAPVAGSLSGTPKGGVVPHEEVHLRGSLPPRKARPVQLQARVDAGAWRTVAKARSKPSGSFAFTTTAAATAGTTLTYRVLAPATTIGGTRFPARRTPVVSFPVLQAAGTVSVQPLVVDGGGLPATAEFVPARPGRPVTLQGWDGAAWTVLATGVEDTSGRATLDVTALPEGTWQLQARAARWHGAARVTTTEYVVHALPRLDLGAYHSCQVKADGTAWCWGWDVFGQLGDHAYGDRDKPVQVAGTGWVFLTGGAYSTCGLKSDGSAWCWGNNYYGQLGDGTGVDSLDPVQVPGEWVGLDIGAWHTCGVRSDGTAWCWGDNRSGQLGDDSVQQRLSPVQVGTAADWTLVEAGYAHTCGLRTDRTVWCWGSNGNGRLGDGTTEDRHVPVQAGSEADWVQVSTGDSGTCGVRAWGTAWCWGSDALGLLGTGYGGDVSTPVQVGTATDWLRVVRGTYQTCGARDDGSAWCWGLNNAGQLGTGLPGNSGVPVQVAGGGWTQRIVTGSAHVCALAADTTTWCWGDNAYGQIGDGTSGDGADRSTPTQVVWP